MTQASRFLMLQAFDNYWKIVRIGEKEKKEEYQMGRKHWSMDIYNQRLNRNLNSTKGASLS